MTGQNVAAYGYTDDLWIVTSYFNPRRYVTKRRNYQRFLDEIDRSHLNWLVVECAFGTAPFELTPSPRVLHVRARDIMWQKERLLNIAIHQLPETCAKVAWVDCDIVFDNPDWVIETSALLEHVPVVQPFHRVVRLPMGRSLHTDTDTFFAGFCALQNRRMGVKAGRATGARPPALEIVYCDLCGSRMASSAVLCPDCRDCPRASAQANAAVVTPEDRTRPTGDFAAHGHTGFAWAARKDLLLHHGLYDVGLSGTGDHLMAHAMCGDWESPCIPRLVGANGPHLDYFLRWADRVYRAVRGRVAHVEGTVSHLWHGDDANRHYKARGWELAEFGFDPVNDLRLGDSGCWEWNTDKPDLHRWAVDYFGLRKEDGDARAANHVAPPDHALPSQEALVLTEDGHVNADPG